MKIIKFIYYFFILFVWYAIPFKYSIIAAYILAEDNSNNITK